MKYLKKILFAASLAVASLGLTSFSANAVLITQDILVTDPGAEFTLGSISVDVPKADLGNGLVSVFGYVELNLLGVTTFDVFDFEAVIDGDNIFAGIEALFFDVMEVGSDDWNYQLTFDAANPAGNFLDIFDANGDPVFFTSNIALSTPPSLVPEPSVLALFAVALVAMGVRRRKA